MATPQTPKPNSGWDTRAWLFGLVGGNVCGAIFAALGYPPMVRILERALPIGGRDEAVSVIQTIVGLICLLLLPGLVSGLARRQTLLWGIIPLLCFWVWAMMRQAAEQGWHEAAQNVWASLLVCLACLLISSGPVSLIRLLLHRRKEKHLRALVALEAQRQAAAVPQEGVWPPPPSYTP